MSVQQANTTPMNILDALLLHSHQCHAGHHMQLGLSCWALS